MFPSKGLEADYFYNHLAPIFTSYSLGSNIALVDWEEIPPNAKRRFGQYNRRFGDRERTSPSDFYVAFKIDHPVQQYICWAAMQSKLYNTSWELEHLIHLFETTPSLKKVGHGEIRLQAPSRNSFFANKPLVGYTETTKSKTNKGYGLHRLVTMNALCQTLWHLPLNSDVFYAHRKDDPALHVWQVLCTLNMANVYLYSTGQRFEFSSNKANFPSNPVVPPKS